jgi:hypothetical protein
MSEKIIDWQKMRSLVRKDASWADRKMIEQRFLEEEEAEAEEAKQRAMIMGAPPCPEAQLVYNHAQGNMGVVVRGGRFVVPLPKGYEGQGLSIAVLPGERIVALHPSHPPLLIDPQSGTSRKL